MKSSVFWVVGLMCLPVSAEEGSLKKCAADLAAGLRKQKSVHVAVLALPHHDNHASDGPLTVAGRLAAYLAADKKIQIVEREKLEAALEELHLADTGSLDPETTKTLGSMLEADVIVTGTLINLPNAECEVNARALLAKNGRVIAASRAIVSRDWMDRRRLDGMSPTPVAYASDPLRAVSKKLVSCFKKNPPNAVTVIDFPYSRNRTSTGSSLVSERMVTYLVQDGANVVERRLLEKILEERKLWESGVTNPDAMKKVGEIMGADAVVTGVLTDMSNSATEIIAKVIKVESGEILGAANAVFSRIWKDTPRLPRIAQPRSAVPVAFIPMESDPDEPARPLKSKHLKARGKKSAYYPAPVPFFVPNGSTPPPSGRTLK